MVTHDAQLAEQADRSIHLRDGRLDPAYAPATLAAASPT
jgi:ABC-type lipoprotein export system ATPase subunit